MVQREKLHGEGTIWTFSDDGTLTLLAVEEKVLVAFKLMFNTFVHWAELHPQIAAVRICDGVMEIPDHAFTNCSLTGAAIPGSVTAIGGYAFHNCWTLASIFLSDGVKTIGEQAFGDCGRLTHVYYGGSEEQWKQISIGDGNEALARAEIHYNC